MRNQYPGTCYRCSQPVEAGAGHFERWQSGWRVQHTECAITYRGSERTHQGPRPAPSAYVKRRATCTRCIQEFTTRRPEQKRCDFCITFELQQKRNTTGASRQEDTP